MRCAVLFGVWLAVGIAAVAVADPPPVMIDLGPVVPTPAPTPRKAERQRLITTITVQNVAGGESVISFEATDVASSGHGKYRTLAAARYSLSEESPKLKSLHKKIVEQIRRLERDMLDYVAIAGPPKDNQSLLGGSSQSEEDRK
jgi:hypothetical protein